jgi:Cu(I)/Ag(I) efflux system membrane fusion protein
VSFVYPTLDPATRTVQLRIELANPRLELKPDMYGDVLLAADLGPRLAVPASAVLETGTRSLVFVETGAGRFAPREVRIGLRLSEQYEVLEGLVEGERIVTSGNFLVDSESRLSALAAPGPAGAGQPGAREP